MKDERFYELTAKFLSHEISEEEKNELTIILQIDQYNKEFETVVDNWNRQSRDYIQFNVEKGLEKLTESLNEKDNSFRWSDSLKDKKRILFNPYLLKIAASIVFLLLLTSVYIFFSRILENKKTDIAWNEQITFPGQRYELILSDKSKIILNAESKIKFPLSFSGNKREIFLEGEAFFDVTHDSLRPFIVSTANISTTVLGTKFNISAFRNDKSIEVSLVDGKVIVTNQKSGAVMLKPMQQLDYDKSANITTVENFDLQEAVGWKDNILKFNREELASVLAKMKRVYGIEFELKEKNFNKFRVTGNFRNESYRTVIESLKKLTGLQYDIINENNTTKKIVFYKK